MFNSKIKLQGLSLEEVIQEGVHGNNPEVTIDDWKFIEYLYNEELGDRLKREYYKGYRDGENYAWDIILKED
ncbi:hypothetical protein NVP1170O_134 [Vibrio phage 1.170.O._10N.261.52.C3]|nr:hypothetical protein NVP1170O_134 [Vibrio phage 1.170.O._10N.261.52.C3]